MLIRIIVKLLGGFWSIKDKLNTTQNKYLKKIYLKLYNEYLLRFSSFIGYNSKIIGIPIFPHGMLGIFISGSSVIGKNCVIFQHVIIGSNSLPDSKNVGSPVIGDNCYIGAGAKIIGNVRIGNNCRIGANAVVTQDVPGNCVVVLEKSKIIQKENLNNRFYSFDNGWVYYSDNRQVTETDEEVLELLNSKF
jgi:serine O-acetyltransferase